MKDTSLTTRPMKNIRTFFRLTFIISVPVYILAAFVPQDMAMFMGMILAITPLIAALVLAFRNDRAEGIKWLLKRTFDHNRITNSVWYIPIFFLIPVVFLLVLGITVLMGETILPAILPVVAIPIVFIVFFIFAICEEVPWMGYAFDTMQERYGAFAASAGLGIIWAAWHLPLYMLARPDPVWIGGQFVGIIFLRVLIAWIYTNTGKSVFAAILFHAVYNVCTIMIPSFYTSVGHITTNFIIVMVAILVTILLDAQTMSQYKHAKQKQSA